MVSAEIIPPRSHRQAIKEAKDLVALCADIPASRRRRMAIPVDVELLEHLILLAERGA